VYPQDFMNLLAQEIRDYVEAFWKGLSTRVLIPCPAECALGRPGRGLFDIDKLLRYRRRGKNSYPCPVPDCDGDMSIPLLLEGESLQSQDRVLPAKEAIRAVLREEVLVPLMGVVANSRELVQRFDSFDRAAQAAIGQANERLRVIMRGFDDEAANGPRLFSVEPLRRSLKHPSPTDRRVVVRLWCEHSRAPVSVLSGNPNAGVYEFSFAEDWWRKIGPAVKATTLVLRLLLPVSLAGLEMDLSESQWKSVSKQLALTNEMVDLADSLTGEPIAPEDPGIQGLSAPLLAEGGALRMFHEMLSKKDPSFGDLRRVRDQQGRFLWVHPRFVSIYQPPLPIMD
jgi:hypothetical protein